MVVEFFVPHQGDAQLGPVATKLFLVGIACSRTIVSVAY